MTSIDNPAWVTQKMKDAVRACEQKDEEIATLRRQLSAAQHEVAKMDAVMRVVVPELLERLTSTCVWCGIPAPEGLSSEELSTNIRDHLAVCTKHPMRALEVERDEQEKRHHAEQQAMMEQVAEANRAAEEHRKALESQQAEAHTLRRAFLHERHRANIAGAPPEHAYNAQWSENLLADERRALVRARNEGRKGADAKILATANPPAFMREHHPGEAEFRAALSGYTVGVNHALDTIRALMEPEA